MSELSLTRFKLCTKCRCTKIADSQFFRGDRTKKDGLYPSCKVCSNAQRRQNKRTSWDESQTRKQCSDCGELKPRSAFGVARKSKDKLHCYCKACTKLRGKVWRNANRERALQTSRAYYWENKEDLAQKRSEYYLANKERENQMARDYHRRNRDEIMLRHRAYREQNREYFKRWKSENRDKIRAQNGRRRARLVNADGEYTAQDVWDMLESQGHLCCYCEAPLQGAFHADHMTPLSRGGANGWENIAVSCPPCNLGKHAMTAEEFMNQKYRL